MKVRSKLRGGRHVRGKRFSTRIISQNKTKSIKKKNTAKKSPFYCFCRSRSKDTEFMIQCDGCDIWYHGSCVELREEETDIIDKFFCPPCRTDHGSIILIKNRRTLQRLNYREINEGISNYDSENLEFIHHLKNKKFLNQDDVLLYLTGNELTEDYLSKNGFSHPILVRSMDGLGMRVPPSDLTIEDIERYVGSLREIEVIDTLKQSDFKLKMGEWTRYFTELDRKHILNVISLEVSNTGLGDIITPPKIVRKFDWVTRYWPEDVPHNWFLSKPQVQKYCLMSVKGSYTDFHIDFGGSSVWYHPIKGKKIFYIIEPTDTNIKKYERWSSSHYQSNTFFGDIVDRCYQCEINAGETMFIPTGWIHAVYTPIDSIVFGGNYLTKFNIPLQLKVYNIERNLNTPAKFLYPNYETLYWLAGDQLLQEVNNRKDANNQSDDYLILGLEEMVKIFKEWSRNRKSSAEHQQHIPCTVSPEELIIQITHLLDSIKKKHRKKISHSKPHKARQIQDSPKPQIKQQSKSNKKKKPSTLRNISVINGNKQGQKSYKIRVTKLNISGETS
ncbi:Lysine-specific demethylase 7B-like [Oopsacas minuta]|uniref:Lysine-specific demethylase 7B-like n=1 Tax=Oopsacas minuta TaxID=111878 RepID=A0AAV7JDA2_9METZ|nr:Lysine-specific demethylase 7B-like [Oopsacas minuta]